jgi:hypothetical protein
MTANTVPGMTRRIRTASEIFEEPLFDKARCLAPVGLITIEDEEFRF